ncbi:CLUMA_CG018311, isoform A [Clunio marinus]|uniref:CLUMA_CG018311, isoform A n=1 Tax=Clunio marinus TaxID=568069 RepID=A0A1J1IZM1_9DIPT|nr:CLUMA_CG018311, isoform A [Clunio marinus]
MKCLVNYLRNRELLEGSYTGPEIIGFKINSEDSVCLVEMQKKLERIYQDLAEEIKSDKDHLPFTDCMIERLKEFQLGEVFLKKYYYEKALIIPKRKRQRRISTINNVINRSFEISLKICASNEILNNLFDKLYPVVVDMRNRRSLYPKINDCFNLTALSLEPSNNISLSTSNCEFFIESKRDEFETQIEKEFGLEPENLSRKCSECIADILHTENYYMKAIIASDIEKIDDKNHTSEYIEEMRKVYTGVLNCLEL